MEFNDGTKGKYNVGYRKEQKNTMINILSILIRLMLLLPVILHQYPEYSYKMIGIKNYYLDK